MSTSRSPRRLRHALIGVAVVAAGLGAGLVVAQPTPGPVLPDDAPAGVVPSEQAPPVKQQAPDPLVIPPVDEKEVQPAEAPKAQVVEKVVPQSVGRDRFDIAILQALDKVTAETIRFEAPVGRAVRWKGLIFTVRACEKAAADEPIADNIAYLTVFSQPRAQPGKLTPPPRQTFRGWMYASSPGLNPMEHATYDAWVISCKASAPPPAPPAPVVAKPEAPAPKAEPEEAPDAPAAEAPAPPAPEASPAPKTEPIA